MMSTPLPFILTVALVVATSGACYSVPPSDSSSSPEAAAPAIVTASLQDESPPQIDGPVDIRGLTWSPHPRVIAAGAWVFAPAAVAWARWQSGAATELSDWRVAQVRDEGEFTSFVMDAQGQTTRIPNALVLRIPRSAQLAVGDIVLAPREARMVPAVVMSLAGQTVTLADLGSGRPATERHFEARSWHLLPLESGQPGASVLCADREATRMYTLLDDNGENLLVLGPDLVPTVRRRDRCRPLDPEPVVMQGEQLLAYVYGGLRRVEVGEVRLDEAREWIRFSLAGRTTSEEIPLFQFLRGEPTVGDWANWDTPDPE
jgi:hypothetical protein